MSRRSSKPRRSRSRNDRRSCSRSARATKSRSRSGGDGGARRSRDNFVNERKEERGRHRGSDDCSQSSRKSWAWVLVAILVAMLFAPSLTAYLPAVEVIHGQLPEPIRTWIPLQQLQQLQETSARFIENLTKHKGIQMKIQKPKDPGENNTIIMEMTSSSSMVNVIDLKKCKAWRGLSDDVYDGLIDVTSRELNFTEDMTKEMKFAKHTGEYVNSVEKFEQSLDGMYYFATYQTKRLSDKTMDLVAVVYGFRWNLAKAQVETGESGESSSGYWGGLTGSTTGTTGTTGGTTGGELKMFFQSTTPQTKDLFMKSLRVKAVETFKEICHPDLLTVVDHATKGQESTVNNGKEDTVTKNVVDSVLKYFVENGMPGP